MFRKMFEEALGELLQEMAPERPKIDPPGERRRPDMTGNPGEDGARRAVGEPRLEPVRPVVAADRPRQVKSPGLEGRNTPREVFIEDAGSVMRDAIVPEGPRIETPRANLRTTIAEGPAMAVNRRRRQTHPLRAQLQSPASIRNAYRIMEVLRPPVALRGMPGQERDR